MFLEVVSTHNKYIMNDFALAPRTNLLNFKYHTVTNGTDLRKSPKVFDRVRYRVVKIQGSVHNCYDFLFMISHDFNA